MLQLLVTSIFVLFIDIVCGSDRFYVLGDWGTNSLVKYAGEQKKVAKAMVNRSNSVDYSFLLTTGDNFYDFGVWSSDDPLWKKDFLEIYLGNHVIESSPWYVTLGNHDYEGLVDVQINWNGDKRWKMPSRNYTLNVPIPGTEKAILFILIDTSPFILSYYQHPETREMKKQLASQHWQDQLKWIEDVMEQAPSNSELVLVGHHPVFSKNGGMVDLQTHLLPLIQKYHVCSMIAGHVHALQMLSGKGCDWWISGGGGAVRSTNGHTFLDSPPEDEPSVLFSAVKPGFLEFRLNSKSMEGRFYGVESDLLFHHETPYLRD